MSEVTDICKKRMRHLRDLMGDDHIDLVCLFTFFRNFSSSLYKKLANTWAGDALLIPIDGEAILLCNNIDYEYAKDESWISVKRIRSDKRDEEIKKIVHEYLKHNNSEIGVNIRLLNTKSYHFFKKNLNGKLVDIEKTILPNVFFGLYPEEFKFQRRLGSIADIGIKAARESLAIGRRECEIAAEANYEMMRHGSELQWFPTIISSGERSAYGHGWTGERKIKNGDLVIVDLGPVNNGYSADETRTFLLGKDEKKEKMLMAVDRSVEAVLKNLKPGSSCRELDLISRRVLKKNGFPPDYPGGLGHPISNYVVPKLSEDSEDIEKKGMVHTIEPGIYIPGYGGVRIEENVIVTDDGFELLTRSPRLI